MVAHFFEKESLKIWGEGGDKIMAGKERGSRGSRAGREKVGKGGGKDTEGGGKNLKKGQGSLYRWREGASILVGWIVIGTRGRERL